LEDVVTHFISSSLQPSSIPTYRRAWELYRNFFFGLVGNPSPDFPIPPVTLALFIAHLFQQNYASSTVNTYVSALGYSHRLAGVLDPTKVFFILEMLKGYRKVDPRFDAIPIPIPILTKIFSCVPAFWTPTTFPLCLKLCELWLFMPFCALVKLQSPNNHQL